MGDKCEIILDKGEFAPGSTVSGRIEYSLAAENKIKGIVVKLTGNGRVSWKASRYSYCRAEEIYLDMESEILSGEMKLPQGLYKYPFSFTLPETLPSTMNEGDPTYYKDVMSFVVPLATIEVNYGAIHYTIQTIISRNWSTDLEVQRPLRIHSGIDLNKIPGLDKPVEITKAVRPAGLLKQSGPITIAVRLPMGGYVANQIVSFSVKLQNSSNVDVQYIQFKFVQGFIFQADQNTKRIDAVIGEDFIVKESNVEAGEQRAWNLALKVPSLFVGDLTHSNIIKNYWELRGEVSLPFPHYNFVISVPITLGAVPLPDRVP